MTEKQNQALSIITIIAMRERVNFSKALELYLEKHPTSLSTTDILEIVAHAERPEAEGSN